MTPLEDRMKSIKKIWACFLFLIFSVSFAQQGSVKEREPIDTEHFFNQIMETLPPEAREKVAAASQSKGVNVSQQRIESETQQRVHMQRHDSFDRLPPEVKERIEQTITDIENRRELRMIEFRESGN